MHEQEHTGLNLLSGSDMTGQAMVNAIDNTADRALAENPPFMNISHN